MSNRNQQREQESLNPQAEEIARLEGQLKEALAAEEFFNLASGKLWTQIIGRDIDMLVKEIASDKFINDHNGYLEALGRLRQAKRSLRLMQVAGSSVRKAKIQERLDEK